MASVWMVGVGSDHGADRWGWAVAEHLLRQPHDGCEVRIARSPLDLTGWLDEVGDSLLMICDACRGAGAPGSLHRWEGLPPASLESASSSHDFGVGQVLELARRLGQLPPRLVVWGLEVAPDSPWSPELDAVAKQVATEIGELVSGG